MTGTIYLISSPNTDKIYIGCTTRKLSHRFNEHNSNRNKSKSKIIIDYGNATITAIDRVEDEDNEELKVKELEYIQFYKDICVNFKGIKDSYSKDYKEPYVLDGRYKEHQNTKINCCICNGKYTNSGKSSHFKTKKHQACIKSLM